MLTHKSLFSLAVATLAAIAAPQAASAFTLRGHLTSMDGTYGADWMYNDLFPEGNSAPDTAFVAESRFGDLGGAAEKEFKIFDHSGAGLTGQNQTNFAWENGASYNFKLENDGDNWIYSLFDLDNNPLTSVSNSLTAPFSDIFIRTRADVGMSMVVDNLFLDGVAVGDRSAVDNPTDGWGADYLWIGDVTEPFTLTGRSTMSWEGEQNRLKSALAYQIKVVNLETQPVPEPTLAIGLGVGALAMTRLRRRNR